jgi:hypothetical protein
MAVLKALPPAAFYGLFIILNLTVFNDIFMYFPFLYEFLNYRFWGFVWRQQTVLYYLLNSFYLFITVFVFAGYHFWLLRGCVKGRGETGLKAVLGISLKLFIFNAVFVFLYNLFLSFVAPEDDNLRVYMFTLYGLDGEAVLFAFIFILNFCIMTAFADKKGFFARDTFLSSMEKMMQMFFILLMGALVLFFGAGFGLKFFNKNVAGRLFEAFGNHYIFWWLQGFLSFFALCIVDGFGLLFSLRGEDSYAARHSGAAALLPAGYTPLMWAASQGDIACLRRLLASHRVDVNARHPQDGCTALLLAVKEGDFDAAQALILAGADVNASDKSGVSCKTAAFAAGHADIVQLLDSHGAR